MPDFETNVKKQFKPIKTKVMNKESYLIGQLLGYVNCLHLIKERNETTVLGLIGVTIDELNELNYERANLIESLFIASLEGCNNSAEKLQDILNHYIEDNNL